MKYHIFIANENGVEHIIRHNLTETRKELKNHRKSDVVAVIQGGNHNNIHNFEYGDSV